MSGPGLEAIYKIQNDVRLAAPEIGDGALAGDNKCLKAVNLMFKSFATVIANAALNFGAGSGIVIAGELRQGYVACSIKVDFMSG